MKWDDPVVRMMKDLQRQMDQLKDYGGLYTSAYEDIARLAAERESLLHSLTPDIDRTYLNLAEYARKEVELHKEIACSANHMMEITSATSVVSELLKDHESLARFASEAIGASKYWQAELNLYKGISAEAEAHRLALMGHYSHVAELSLVAKERAMHLNWDAIGLNVGMSQEMISSTVSSFSTLLKDYDHLFQSFAEAEYKMASFPPFVSKLPPIEIITGTGFLETISRKEDLEHPQEETEEGQVAVVGEIEDSLEELLGMLDRRLISLWRGARTSLESSNPDRSRHIVVSLRELVTHVLHQTAPDNDVRSWTSDPQFFDKGGRPTRKARLRFICRSLYHPPFEIFITKDVSAHLELINILQQGTHGISIDLTDEQLRALSIKTEALVRFILVIWNSEN